MGDTIIYMHAALKRALTNKGDCMNKICSGKVALVTGGSRGIGREICLRLADMGCRLLINYASSAGMADEIVNKIKKSGGEAVAVRADMRRVAEIRTMFAECMDQYGRLDILVNNAGTLMTKTIAESTEEDYHSVMDLNLKGVFFCLNQAAEKMSEGGRIINISTTVTKVMFPGYGLYAASKGAVDQLTRVLAKELGPKRITVNSLSPGPVDTELFREGKSEEQIAQMGSMAALGRIGVPEDIAGAVSLLVREEAGWITGQDIYANGGLA